MIGMVQNFKNHHVLGFQIKTNAPNNIKNRNKYFSLILSFERFLMYVYVCVCVYVRVCVVCCGKCGVCLCLLSG
jgi:hypothetical protein